MGAIRVTQGLIVQRTLSNLNAQFRRLLKIEEQMSTGRRVNRPSDDPVDARRAIAIRNDIDKNEQFLSNIEDSRARLTESESMLRRMVDIIHRTRELTIQGASETLAQSQLDEIAVPASWVTSCAFGGADFGDLYIVSADNRDDESLGGCIWRCRPGVTGHPTPLARVGS